MTIVGCGLFALALAILVSTWVLHRDVVKVYYPKKHVGCCQEMTTMVQQAALGGKLNEVEQQWVSILADMED